MDINIGAKKWNDGKIQETQVAVKEERRNALVVHS